MKSRQFTRVLAVLFALVLFAASFAGCAAPKAAAPQMDSNRTKDMTGGYGTTQAAPAAPAPETAMEAPAPAADEAGKGIGNGAANSSNIPTGDRKIIRNANLVIESKKFTADVSSIEQRIAAIGGYVQSSYVTGREPKQWSDPPRSASITARIPADKLDVFLGDMKSIGEVIEENTGSDDVTMQYYDTESRVKVLKIQLERLQSILADSEKLADVLALETEIARIQYEIEQLTTDLRRWDNLVNYCTVTISLNEVTQFTSPTYEKGKLSDRIRDTFNRSVTSVIDFLEGFLVVLIAIVPVLPILLVIAVIIWLIVRASKKAKKKREAEFAQRKTEQTAGENPTDKPENPDKAFR